MESRTTGTVEAKTNTVISVPSRFSGEIYPPVYLTNVKMGGIPRDRKAVMKSECLPELFCLKLMQANYKADPQLEAIRDMLVDKDLNFAEKVKVIGGYLEQYVHDF